MGKYRCAGCHEYFPQPEHRRFGISRVCSDRCAELYSLELRPNREYKLERSLTSARRGAATTSSRAAQGSPIPTDVRSAVNARDRSRCRFCGKDGGHLHHIRYRSEGIDHSETNLITLCHEHHELVHSNKRRWKPLLLAVIWMEYCGRRHLTVPQVERILLHRGYILAP